MNSPTILSITDLKHNFKEVRALAGLSFEVAEGELFGIVGPDGAGKTTLLRAIAGVLAPAEGAFTFFGEHVTKRGQELLEQIGYMPQRNSLYGDLSVEENLRFFGDLFCLSKQVFMERRTRLLSITRLAPFLSRRADALSGGMYKKLALACALLHEPRLLLLDEPTNGVDPISRIELWELLYEFASSHMTIVVSTSYMDEAARCGRVLCLHEGKSLAIGNPEDLVREHLTLEQRKSSVNNFETLFLELVK